MPYSHAVGTTYKNVRSCWAGVEGSWKRIIGRWVGVGGLWKRKFAAGALFLEPVTIRSFAYDPDVPASTVSLSPDGTAAATYTDQTLVTVVDLGPWYDPEVAGVGVGFEIRATRISGYAAVTGDLLNTWLPMSVLRQWSVAGGLPLNQAVATTLDLQIRAIGAVETEVAAPVTLSVVTYSPTNPNPTYGGGGGINQLPRERYQAF